ncbi:hypothetical protein GCM10022210_09000 [Mucilaginibacter dorajii]|uniref:Uncharacterized protein n=2 Tax=Mucilaginibacter dorajii TaxID=692994 RepID=A0ABP7PC06_9SPHI
MVAIAVCSDVFIAIWYQVYLVVVFNKSVKGSVWVTINNIVAVLGTLIFIITFVYMALEEFSGPRRLGPTHSSYASWGVMFVGVDLLHLFITFFLINNLYVSFKTQKIKDPALLERISNDFGEPMKKLLITSLFVTTGSFVIAIAIMIIKTRFWQS